MKDAAKSQGELHTLHMSMKGRKMCAQAAWQVSWMCMAVQILTNHSDEAGQGNEAKPALEVKHEH